MAKANRNINVNNKVNNRRFNCTDVSNKYQPIFIRQNKIAEPHINNRINNDVDEYKNAFNINIDSNVTIHKSRPAPVINRFPERDTLGVSKQSKNLIPGYSKYNEAVRFGRKAYVLGISMVKDIKRNLFNSCLKKGNTRFRPFLGATIKQMETCVKPIIRIIHLM